MIIQIVSVWLSWCLGKDILLGTHVVQVEQVDSEREEVMDLNMLVKNMFNHINLVHLWLGYSMPQWYRLKKIKFHCALEGGGFGAEIGKIPLSAIFLFLLCCVDNSQQTKI